MKQGVGSLRLLRDMGIILVLVTIVLAFGTFILGYFFFRSVGPDVQCVQSLNDDLQIKVAFVQGFENSNLEILSKYRTDDWIVNELVSHDLPDADPFFAEHYFGKKNQTQDEKNLLCQYVISQSHAEGDYVIIRNFLSLDNGKSAYDAFNHIKNDLKEQIVKEIGQTKEVFWGQPQSFTIKDSQLTAQYNIMYTFMANATEHELTPTVYQSRDKSQNIARVGIGTMIYTPQDGKWNADTQTMDLIRSVANLYTDPTTVRPSE